MLTIFPQIILIAIVFAGFFYLKRTKARMSKHYDERQLLLQKQAYANAAWVIFAVDLYIAMNGKFLEQYVSLSFVAFLNIYLLVAIYAVSSILTDAYFLPTNKKRMLALYAVTSILSLFSFYCQWIDGDFLKSGHLYLTDRAATLLAGLVFAAVLLATVYRAWQERQEDGGDE